LDDATAKAYITLVKDRRLTGGYIWQLAFKLDPGSVTCARSYQTRYLGGFIADSYAGFYWPGRF
jgi:hypothetical protein